MYLQCCVLSSAFLCEDLIQFLSLCLYLIITERSRFATVVSNQKIFSVFVSAQYMCGLYHWALQNHCANI